VVLPRLRRRTAAGQWIAQRIGQLLYGGSEFAHAPVPGGRPVRMLVM
jgi:hypothetical protein